MATYDKPIQIRLATTFYDDHVSRDLSSGREISRSKTTVLVELDPEAFADMLSDAEYYATMEGYDRQENREVCKSAERVLAKLERSKQYWNSQVVIGEV